ncbi:MAG: hypothetical protein JNN00_10255 [Chitinophagaceae bacterium]|nr:hypothetical protein [Chitinophagaceae bacterium]
MKQFLERILPQSWVDGYKQYQNKHSAASNRKKWELAGKPLPPPHTVKQEAIRSYQKKSGYNVLVETGTYKGDMILAQKSYFNQIYSIELSHALHEKAKKRFHWQPGITLLQGNSGDVISKVLAELKEPAVFWLDGHYSGGITATIEKYSPIIEELQTISGNNSLLHIILIDDARCFVGEHGYPTIEEMKELTKKDFPGYDFSVDEDIIRMMPQKFV